MATLNNMDRYVWQKNAGLSRQWDPFPMIDCQGK
jgi:hypothetical protein